MSNVYQKTSYYKEVITLRDGKTYTIFKTVSDVKQDGVSLTQRTTVQEVEDNAGSWWQDTNAEKLYVHFTGSGTGQDKTIIAYFKLYFASENIIFNSIFYEGRLNSIGSISNKTSYLLHQGTEIEGGSITLNNCDGFFDTIYEKFIWEKAQLIIKLGSDFMQYSNFLQCGKWYVDSRQYNENNFLLKYFSIKKELDIKIPSEMYDIATYPNIETDAIGKYIPVAYGDFSASLDNAPLLICINKTYGSATSETGTADSGTNTTTLVDLALTSSVDDYYKGWTVVFGELTAKVTNYVGSTKTATMETLTGFTVGSSYTIQIYPQKQYKIAGHAITSISEVYIDYGDGLGWQKITSTDTLSTATFIITTNIDGRYGLWQEGTTKVKALFVGKNADGNMSDIVKDLCTTYAGLVDGTDLDTDSFTASQVDSEGAINDYIDSQITIRDEIDEIVLSTIGYFYTALTGKIKFVVWTPERTTGYDEYQDYEYFSFSVSDIGSDLRNRISVGYGKNYEKSEYHYTTTTNNESIYKYSEREVETIETLLTTKSDADILAARLMWIVNQPGRYVNFETHLRALAKTDTDEEMNIGNKIYVTKTKSPNSTTGGMNAVQMEITGIERNLKDGIISIKCVDTRGMGLNVGIVMANDAPDWATLTAAGLLEQRSASGFVCDNNGYVSYPDGYMISRVW